MENDLIESEVLENEYNCILNTLSENDAEKLQHFVHGLQHNLKMIADWAEIDVDEWGNPYC